VPRNVRNFWLTARADGAARSAECGPRAADGGLTATLKVRHRGAVVDALRIRCWAGNDGALYVDIEGIGNAAELGPAKVLADGTIRLEATR
jgi:hypothetical protein